MSDAQRMHDRFVRLCEIASPTGDERAVADAVAAELSELGVEFVEDDSAGPAEAGAGNLIARIAGRDAERWVAFASHLDTVPHDGPIEVELENGAYRSRGETILGADNKAAVTVLMEIAARHAADPPAAGVELIFTVAEEDGLRGANALEVESLRSPYGFVLDHASPIGEVIDAAPTYQRLIASFEGQEAHSGINPEDGHSAIAAAAAAVARMELGRLDEETTANVGIIEGGTASNIVAGHCRILGEARSIDSERAAATIGAMVDACSWAATENGCDVDVEVIEMFRGYRADSASEPVRVATEALERCEIEPVRTATGGGSDANALIARGWDCVLLANGTTANHTPQESVPAANLDRMLDICEAIVSVAGAADGMLKLRRGIVVSEAPLTVGVDGQQRPAWADASLVGEVREGDEVVVNVEARDLRLGSGGFDVVHVNLTRGLEGNGADGEHVMKLNYSSLQHPVRAVEGAAAAGEDDRRAAIAMPVLVIPLHGHLAPAAWAAAQAGPDLRVGYVQSAGGALPGSLSNDVRLLRDEELLAGHVTAAPAYGGEHEAMSVAGALDAAATGLGWDAAIAGPGPGIIGSETRLGNGGMAALDSAHAALALGLPTLLSPRLSEADERPRHRGLSHHSRTVLELVLAGVVVPYPARDEPLEDLVAAAGDRHRLEGREADVDGYSRSGLPARVMGRGVEEDSLFFEAPLAAGAALGETAREGSTRPSG